MAEDDKLKELGIFTPQESIAKAIERLSSADRIKMMSSLKKQQDVHRFALMYSVAEELKLKWLEHTADNMLMLMVSLDKGRGRKDIVEVVKNPLGSFGEGLKDRIKSFIRSE